MEKLMHLLNGMVNLNKENKCGPCKYTFKVTKDMSFKCTYSVVLFNHMDIQMEEWTDWDDLDLLYFAVALFNHGNHENILNKSILGSKYDKLVEKLKAVVKEL